MMCIMMLRNFLSFAGPNIILNGLTHMLSIHQCKWSHVMLSCPRWWPDPGACTLVPGVWVPAQVEGPGIHHHGADTAYCPGTGDRDVFLKGVVRGEPGTGDRDVILKGVVRGEPRYGGRVWFWGEWWGGGNFKCPGTGIRWYGGCCLLGFNFMPFHF